MCCLGASSLIASALHIVFLQQATLRKMSLTRAPKGYNFDFTVKHLNLEFSPGAEPGGRRRFRHHKNIESYNFYMGHEPHLDRYFDKTRAQAMLQASHLAPESEGRPVRGLISQEEKDNFQGITERRAVRGIFAQRDTEDNPRLSERRPIKGLAAHGENDEILRLKALLREKEQELKEIANSSVTQSSPRVVPKRASPPKQDLSPEQLYNLSRELSRQAQHDPNTRSYSVEPSEQLHYREEIKPYADLGGPITDLLKHPAFFQPRLTQLNAKVTAGNPMESLKARSITPDRMAHYGNMMFR